MGVLFAASAATAAEPLHQRIDAVIDAACQGPAADLCSDAEFIRRAYLDLVGVIPTADEAREFLDDQAADKRTRLVDRLLADERFAFRMRNVFDVMLMERRPDKYVKRGPWREYLLASFHENKPLNQLAREILWADPDRAELQAAARFYLDREAQPDLITRDIGRLLLGRDVQCAQCHDHPLIGDYSQAEYYGLYAFLNRSFLFEDKQEKRFLLAEKADGEVTYSSVFDAESKYTAAPHLPDRPEIEEPTFAEGESWEVKPPKDGRGVPKFSRREQLAEGVTSGDCQPFNRNLANRLWAVLFGRGIVHPLDLHHGDNPPVNPELLDLLAEELAAMKFDLRGFLRELALTRAYQRSGRLPEGVAADGDEASEQLTRQGSDHFFLHGIQPLSAEQMAISLHQATGDLPARLEAARKAAEAKLKTKQSEEKPTGDEKDGEKSRLDSAEIARQAWRTVYDQLQPVIDEMVEIFAQGDGQPTEDFEGRAIEALYLSNSDRIQALVRGRLAQQLASEDDPAGLAEQMYLAVLSRRPEAEEAAAVSEYLAAAKDDRPGAVEEMIWGLVASTEFRFNH